MKYLICLLFVIGCQNMPMENNDILLKKISARELNCDVNDLDIIYFSSGLVGYACNDFMYSPDKEEL